MSIRCQPTTLSEQPPRFIISTGTQVVLKVAKALHGGEDQKKRGSVGLVVESPPNNDHPYMVQFADEQTIKAYFRELARGAKKPTTNWPT